MFAKINIVIFNFSSGATYETFEEFYPPESVEY
jgi:hypothetical protein